MWAPGPASGTVNAQLLKLPTPLALQFVETWWLPKVRVMRLFGVKPLPLTAAPLPTGPLLGVRLMPGLRTKPAEAEFALASDAVTVWVPLVAGGGVNTQELKLPLPSALQDVETGLPSTRKVMVLFGAKPRPRTARRGPSEPRRGVRLMDGLAACAWRPVAGELEACAPTAAGANPMPNRANSSDS